MKSILLVEDTLHLSEEIADILRLEGYEVTIASNALLALDFLSGSNPNLIITDLLMPGMGGLELIGKIRSMPAFQSIPIIILSAKITSLDKMQGKEAGANAFIPKPCKIQDLMLSIDSLLN